LNICFFSDGGGNKQVKKGSFFTSCCFGSSCDLELLSGVMGVYVAKYMQRRRDEEEVLSSNICNMNISISVLATI
jgi:hypothetical protein